MRRKLSRKLRTPLYSFCLLFCLQRVCYLIIFRTTQEVAPEVASLLWHVTRCSLQHATFHIFPLEPGKNEQVTFRPGAAQAKSESWQSCFCFYSGMTLAFAVIFSFCRFLFSKYSKSFWGPCFLHATITDGSVAAICENPSMSIHSSAQLNVLNLFLSQGALYDS